MRAALAVLASLSWILWSLLAAPAGAEVWPVPARAACAGPFATLEPGALALWSNPALAAVKGAGWRAGFGSLEPFLLPALARTDAAVAARGGAWGASAGWSRFGQEDLGASAVAVGMAGTVGKGALAFGVSGRRQVRDGLRAWALDTGIRASPARDLTVAAVARSMARAGDLPVAPDPEWEIDVSWSAGPASLAASLTRDATGPVASTVASRVDAGPLRIFSQLERVAGGETRVGIGLETRVPLGFRCFLSREEGPVLAESRAGGIEWESGSGSARGKSSGAPRRREPADTSSDSAGEAEWDSLAAQDALENQVDPDAAPAGDSGDPVEVESPSSARPPDGEPGDLSWLATVGGRPDRESGLGSSAALAFGSPPGRPWLVDFGLVASRDPGERGLWDEERASATIRRGARAALTVGSFDVESGADLDLAAAAGAASVSSAAASARSAAAPGRSPTSALTGVAGDVALGGGLHALAFAARAARDARLAMAGAWPILGRYHRTALERSRRGALDETETGFALTGRAFVASWVRAEYRGDQARQFPDGVARRGGDWLGLAWSGEARAVRWRQTIALGPGGEWGTEARLRRHAERSGVSSSFSWRHRSPGFSGPEAVPRTEPLDGFDLRLDARARRGRPGFWLDVQSQTRWASPAATVAPGHIWDRWWNAGLRLGNPARGLALEALRRETWKENADPSSPFGLAGRAAYWMWRARASWRPPGAACRLWLTWRRRGPGESWQLALESAGAGASAGARGGAGQAGRSPPKSSPAGPRRQPSKPRPIRWPASAGKPARRRPGFPRASVCPFMRGDSTEPRSRLATPPLRAKRVWSYG